MSDRCEPPEHLRGVDGWHWLELHGMTQPAPYRWQNEGIWCGLERDGGAVRPLWAAKLGYRYHAPAASPEIVRGLVEALEGLERHVVLNGIGQPRYHSANTPAPPALEAARAALAAAKEAGL